MGHISQIWMIIEEQRHGEFTVKTQIDTHGDLFPQYHKCIMHTDKTYRPIFNISTSVTSVSTLSIIEGRSRNRLQ